MKKLLILLTILTLTWSNQELNTTITTFLEKKFPNYKEHSMKKLTVGGDYIVVLESRKKASIQQSREP